MLYKAKVISNRPYSLANKKGNFVDAILTPGFVTVKEIELPRRVDEQIQVGRDDIILVWRENEYSAVMVSKLKDNPEYLKLSLRSEVQDGPKYFQPGEVQVESRGGAYHYLSNRGDYHIVAGVTNNAKIYLEGKTNSITTTGANITTQTLGQCRFIIRTSEEEETHEMSLQLHDWQEPTAGLLAELNIDETTRVLLQRRDGAPILPGGIDPSKELSAIELKDDDDVEIRTKGNHKIVVMDYTNPLSPTEKARIEIQSGKVIIEADSIELG